MRGILIHAVVIVVLFGGCRGLWHRGLPQPAALPVAHHVRVEQLVFHSDFDLPREHRMVQALTSERDDVCRTLGLPSSDEPIDVYLFRDAETYGSYLARYFPSVPSRRAFFLETDSRLAVYAHWSDHMAEDLRHEVAHGYLHSVVPNLPLWLDEGLAEFFEVPHGLNGLNRPHLDLLADMSHHEGWRPDLAKLEQLTDAAQMEQLQYAEAWAWAYFLLHSDPERRQVLTSYLAELRSHGAAEPLSQRLAGQGVDLNQMLGDYLAGLSHGRTLR
jgi:hypothetical protein